MKWDVRFLRLAREVSTWSKDPGTRIGAVVVDDRRTLATAYNGFPRGMADSPDRLENREFKLRYTIHAELNAILNAASEGVRLQGSTMYVHGLPMCCDCARAAAQAGIKRVVMCYEMGTRPEWEESFSHSAVIFHELGIEYEFVDPWLLDP